MEACNSQAIAEQNHQMQSFPEQHTFMAQKSVSSSDRCRASTFTDAHGITDTSLRADIFQVLQVGI